MFAGLVLWTTRRVLSDIADVLMERVPRGLNIRDIEDDILEASAGWDRRWHVCTCAQAHEGGGKRLGKGSGSPRSGATALVARATGT